MTGVQTRALPISRLHIWHSSLVTPDATPLHTHPWNFTSEVILGQVRQNRYSIDTDGSVVHGRRYQRQRIICGEGGGVVGDSDDVVLYTRPKEYYDVGDKYHQEAHEIHESYPIDSTITIITREYLEDTDHAFVFIPEGEEFGSAAPRPASRAEVLYITREVLHAYQVKS